MSGFKDLTSACCIASLTDWLPWFVEHGATDCRSALALEDAALKDGMSKEAMARLQNDFYAQSNMGANAGRFKTWKQLA